MSRLKILNVKKKKNSKIKTAYNTMCEKTHSHTHTEIETHKIERVCIK